MNAKQEFSIYLLLIICAGAISLLLVTDFFKARAERNEFSRSDRYVIQQEGAALGEPTPLETAIYVFVERENLFSELMTPKPTPTTPILPTPTNTMIPLVNEGWVLKNVIGQIVQLQTGDGRTWVYREGDIIPKGGPEVYRIHKVEKDRIFLRRKSDGVQGWFSKDGGVEYTTGPPPE